MFPVPELDDVLPQDVHDPVWEDDADVAAMEEVDDPNDEFVNPRGTLRHASGALGFLDNVEEVVEEFLTGDTVVKSRLPRLDPVRTREVGSDKWRGSSLAVTAAMSSPIIVRSDKRRKLTLINYGPGLVWLCSIGGAKEGAQNVIRLPISGVAFDAPRVLTTKDDVWAVSAVGTVATVEVIEEFDMDDC